MNITNTQAEIYGVSYTKEYLIWPLQILERELVQRLLQPCTPVGTTTAQAVTVTCILQVNKNLPLV